VEPVEIITSMKTSKRLRVADHFGTSPAKARQGVVDPKGMQSDNLITMKTTLTEFQRNFRKAREAADRGDPVIVKGENGEYLFERRSVPTDHPFVGLEGVFGAVKLPRSRGSLGDKVRRRLSAKDGNRRRRTA
jgi:hypothetical protein